MLEIQRGFDRGVRAVRAAWKRAGVGGVATLAVHSRVVPRKLVFVHEVDVLRLVEMNGRTLVPLTDAFQFATADASILDELVECTQAPGSIEERRRTLAHVLALSSSCITVRHRGRVVAYCCTFARRYLLTYDDYGPKTLSLALDPAAIFLGNAFVRPEYRMRGLFLHLVRDCKERYPPGTHFFGHIDFDNIHSFNSHRRLGFVPLLTVTCLGLGPACFFFQRPFGTRTQQGTRVDHAATLTLVDHEDTLALSAGA